MRRLFAAIPAGIAVQKSLMEVHDFLLGYSESLKVVKPENYHMTIKFLGDTDEDLSEIIAEGFSRLEFNIQKIDTEITGLGAFPDIKGAAVLWCGMKIDKAVLGKILKVTDYFFSEHGFESSVRKLHPHITLARVRKKMRVSGEIAAYLKNNRDTLYADSELKRIVLYESRLLRDGPVYSEYSSAALN